MILGAIHDRVWVALMLLTAAFGLGFALAVVVPCWCGEGWRLGP